jgi:hypothetical protein
MSQLPLRTEWRTGTDLPPRSVVETTVDIAIPYTPREPAIPISTRGMAHITRSGAISFDLQSDSEISVHVFGFGPGEFADDRWGKDRGLEMLAANVGIEGGGMNGYDPAHGTWQQCLNAFEQKRITDGVPLSWWTGPLSVTDDGLFSVPQNLAALMAQPGWQGYLQGWRNWLFSTGHRPRFVTFKDEIEFYAGQPDDMNDPDIAVLAPYGGMEAVVAAIREASRCPVAPGLHAVDLSNQIGYSKWLDPKYSDISIVYHPPNNIPSPWSGQTLRHLAESLSWAARHRDPNRPLSLNVSIITARLKKINGEWVQSGNGTAGRTIAAQPWLCLAYGATVIRCYALHSWPGGPPAVADEGTEYQQAVKPGDPAYYALLSSAGMVRDYTPQLLGAEQAYADAGPNFMVGHRLSSAGRIWFCVNLSEREQMVPLSAVPDFQWTKREQMDASGRRESKAVTLGMVVPPNGVIILTSRP